MSETELEAIKQQISDIGKSLSKISKRMDNFERSVEKRIAELQLEVTKKT